MQYIKLSNGVPMPMLGYGTLRISQEKSRECTLNAFKAGYRLIDTAASYLNEHGIGQAIKESNISRDEIFITTKVWVQDAGYEKTLKACERSLRNLGLDYIDLYLVHQPYSDYYGTWRAMEQLYVHGKVRAIGVCNFSAERLVDLCLNCSIKPMVNQVELHPFFHQCELKHVIDDFDCKLQAWGPFVEGQKCIFENKTLKDIGSKHDKTVAQIILRWHIQHQMIAIPKTVHPERMEENIHIWDFELDEEDLEMISKMDLGYSEIIDHQSYKTAMWLNKYKIHHEEE